MRVMRKSIYIIITGAILFLTQYGILFPQTQPTITTTTVSNLTATTALSGGNITSDGGGTIVAKGVCWSTHSNPTIADNRTSDGTGIGPFDSNITGLLPSTMYHIRAYATNCAGTAYGNDFTFTTIDGPPVVITTPITAITQESVTVGGNVISDNADLKGIVYGTSPEPAVDVGDAQIASGGSGSGSYECSISGIPTNTLYYLRAYAENSFGYSYGEQLTVILRINQAGATVNDNDGNTYNTVKIGNQVWFTENLKTSRYSDGSSIPNLTLDADWIAEDGSAGHNGAYCWNSNNENYKNPYGALYNWYAANNGKLCPEGWHVPTDDDWSTLTTYLLGESVAGGKLKESSTTHWCSPNLGATNETGFTALPGGYRDLVGYFAPVEPCSGYGQWWSATENSSVTAPPCPPEDAAIRDPSSSNGTFPVVLELVGAEILDPGFGFEEGEPITVTPSNGAELVPKIGNNGQITGIDVVRTGIGFTAVPEINIDSLNGYNAIIKPVFKVVKGEDVGTLRERGVLVINVVDCVGKPL